MPTTCTHCPQGLPPTRPCGAQARQSAASRFEDGEQWEQEEAKVVVACGGLRGDHLEALHRPAPFAIRPRRGDYILFGEGEMAADNASAQPDTDTTATATATTAAAASTASTALRGHHPLGQVPSASS